ncbi:MAG: hypothetical protein Q9M20_01770, partial [Mariprofundaceae bacterium]|nr:hypothetical protein [Mariprofundaceae bacterium]
MIDKISAKTKNNRIGNLNLSDVGVPENDQIGMLAISYDSKDLPSLINGLPDTLKKVLLVDDPFYNGKPYFGKHLHHLHIVLTLDDYKAILRQEENGLNGRVRIIDALTRLYNKGCKSGLFNPVQQDAELRVCINRNGAEKNPSYPRLKNGCMLLVARPNIYIHKKGAEKYSAKLTVKEACETQTKSTLLFPGQIQCSVGSSYWDNICLASSTSIPPLFFAFKAHSGSFIEDLTRDEDVHPNMLFVVGLRRFGKELNKHDYWLRGARIKGSDEIGTILLRTLQGKVDKAEEILHYYTTDLEAEGEVDASSASMQKEAKQATQTSSKRSEAKAAADDKQDSSASKVESDDATDEGYLIESMIPGEATEDDDEGYLIET